MPHWLLEKKLVVKVLEDEPRKGSRLDRGRTYEEFILGSVRRPSLVGCLGFTQSPPFHALFERCNRGSLSDALNGSDRSKEKAVLLEAIRTDDVRLVVQLAEGLAYLHGRGLLHCDLHTKNVLLHSDEDNVLALRVADFGLCSRVSDRRGHKVVRLQERDKYRKQYPFVAPETDERRRLLNRVGRVGRR